MAESDVLLERGEVALVTLNRPERLNALSWGLVDRFYEVMDEISADPGIRCVVVTGAGRGFCSGTDLKDEPATLMSAGAEGRYALQRKVAGITVRMRDIPQPLVAAVNGVAAGGGLSIAAACDVRIAAPAASFMASFINIGLSAGDLGLSWFLPRIVSAGDASRIMLSGAPIDAPEALRIGLVAEIADDAVAAARGLAGRIAGNASLGVRLTKELLNASLGGADLRQMVEMENRTQILCTFSDGFERATSAFRERKGR